MPRALPVVERASGRDSIEVAELLEKVSIGLINQNDCAMARPMISRASTIYTRHAPEPLAMARALEIASLCAAGARRSELMSAALQLRRKLEGDESAGWLVSSASYYRDKGDLARADCGRHSMLRARAES